ncbi:TIR-like protein FxsC [Streptomyces sp. NPDC089919]|uniref:TIR-like protein FxsC n=1 Tax=Streptomyces sp. NPDC089919 TaxID=3155188 RepID=UPI00342BA7E8
MGPPAHAAVRARVDGRRGHRAGPCGVPARRERCAGAREVARALRPLRRPWPGGRRPRLDVGRTVAEYARTGVLLPAFGPAPERWFDLTVVVDRSPTMAVWADTVDELLKVLATTGAFRTVRVRKLDLGTPADRSGTVPVRSGPGGGLGAAQRRRLVLVVSDCVAGADGGRFWDRIHAWAAVAPTVLVNPLPPRIWRPSGLDLPAVTVTTPGVPGVPNARLLFETPPLLEAFAPAGDRLPVPVTGLSPRSLARWARMLMRVDPSGCAAVLMPGPGRDPVAPPPAPAWDSDDLVEAFLHRAGAPAVRLAVLCSPYERLSTALLHLVRQELVPEAEAADLAEVVVGGLVTVEAASGTGIGTGAVLRFRDGVRERLAPRLGVRDAQLVRDAMSRFLTARGTAAGGLSVLVPDAEGEAALPADPTPLAEVPAETLTRVVPRRSAPPSRGFVVPETPPRDRPYFFLSYAHTPRFGPTGADPDMWVERLFRDLCEHVMALTDLPEGEPAGFMDREIRSGEGWSERLSSVLANCRVFVPLYSPRYFASETCGREWFAFAQRSIRHEARTGRAAQAMVPALWVPVPDRNLPLVARRLQHDPARFGARYASEGLHGLMKLRVFAQDYERAVYELAKSIVSTAQRVDLSADSAVDYRSAPSAFGQQPAAGAGLRIAVAAPTRRTLPEGRDPAYYGETPDDWNPYHPQSTRPLAHLATELAYQLNSQVNVSTLEAELDLTQRGEAVPGPLLLLVDRWASRVPALRARLAALDATHRPSVSVIIAANPRDAQSDTAAGELTQTLARVIPHLITTARTDDPRTRAGRAVRTLEEFSRTMPAALELAYRDYFRHAQPYPPAPTRGDARPRLRDIIPEPPGEEPG